MKKLLIIGGGTAGTMMSYHCIKRLNLKEWSISLIDPHEEHYYQPGFLFVPFGIYTQRDIVKKKSSLLPQKINWIKKEADVIEVDKNLVKLKDGSTVEYDILIIATGSRIVPEETQGLLEDGWGKNIFDFYTPKGAKGLCEALKNFRGGDLVVHLKEMPIKCPVAPLEFIFLADYYLSQAGLREKTRLTYVTPLDGAFTKPTASKALGHFLEQKNIHVVANYDIEKVENKDQKLVSYDEREVPYDLLVTVPTNMGDELIERSEFGDELNFVPVDKNTLQAEVKDNVFVLGDATDVPASKAGSVAHFQAEVLINNIVSYIEGKELVSDFDGHANCYIETGYKKGMLIDFNYDQEPVTGKFPLAGIGPFSLLKESRINHFGKMAFKWVYWNLLLKARRIPLVKSKMQLKGKNINK